MSELIEKGNMVYLVDTTDFGNDFSIPNTTPLLVESTGTINKFKGYYFVNVHYKNRLWTFYNHELTKLPPKVLRIGDNF